MIPTEQQEAEKLAEYLRLKKIPFTHIPNETGGTLEAKRRAVRMKRAGVSRGFPDYIVFLNEEILFIELKRIKHGRLSKEQTEWLKFLKSRRASVLVDAMVAYGADEAIERIKYGV